MKKIILILMLAVVVCGFIACDTASAVIDNYIYEKADSYTVGGGTVAQNSVNSIYISWVSGTVNIVGDANATDITISEENVPQDDKLKLRYLVDGTVLKIRFMKSGANVLKSFAGKILTVTVPTNKEFTEIEVENVSADCKINNIKAVSAEVDNVSGKTEIMSCNIGKNGLSLGNVSGKIQVTDCTIGNGGIEAENVSGNIIVNSNVSGELDLQNVSGNIKFNGTANGEIVTDNVSGDTELNLDSVPKSIETESVSGDVLFDLANSTSGFKLTFETASGELTSSVATRTESNVYYFGDESLKIDVEIDSGDLIVNIK